MKDHLGSIRTFVDTSRTVVSTQDFDMWGHELEGRTSSSQNAKYDFTGKERDTETDMITSVRGIITAGLVDGEE